MELGDKKEIARLMDQDMHFLCCIINSKLSHFYFQKGLLAMNVIILKIVNKLGPMIITKHIIWYPLGVHSEKWSVHNELFSW